MLNGMILKLRYIALAKYTDSRHNERYNLDYGLNITSHRIGFSVHFN
jgi:hypothetical protein